MNSKFRRMRKGDPDPVHLSPTDLGKCPAQIIKKKQPKKYPRKYSPELIEILEAGNRLHVTTSIYRDGSKGLIDNEKHMKAISLNEDVIFSGYADFIMIDENGLYIEDLKTTKREAFFHFNKSPDSYSEKVQLSAYRWLYWIIFGVKIKRGIITKIDRIEPLNRISLKIDMFSIDRTEELILNNPALLLLQGKISQEEFENKTLDFVLNNGNKWLCKYCDDRNTCKINRQRKIIEKKKKAEQKAKKEEFQKLLK